MNQIDKYKYRFRPEYNSENLLIEIFSGVEKEIFLSILLVISENIALHRAVSGSEFRVPKLI